MRARIEVFEVSEIKRKGYEYVVDLAIGPYGRYEQIGRGFTNTKEEAETQANRDAINFLTDMKRTREPVIKKYININTEIL